MAPLDDGDRERLSEAVAGSTVAEFTATDDGKPRTFPVSPFYDREREVVVVSSPPAFAGKFAAVRDSPAVSLRFYQADPPVLVRGRGRVRDDLDPWAGARYVRGLIADTAAGDVRETHSAAAARLDSRLGRLLFDWYALRVVLEIEPTALAEADSEPPLATPSAWPAVGMDGDEAAGYDRVVLGVVDEDGPAAWPVAAMTCGETDAVLESPAALRVDDARPACLLCHWHTADLSGVGQRLVRGRLQPATEAVRFTPASSFTLRNASLLDALRFVLAGKRRTRAYFDERRPWKWRWSL